MTTLRHTVQWLLIHSQCGRTPLLPNSKVKSLSCIQFFATPQTVACQAPPMGFSMGKYWSELPFPSTEDLPDPGIKPKLPALQPDSLPSEPPGKPLLPTSKTFSMPKNKTHSPLSSHSPFPPSSSPWQLPVCLYAFSYSG